MVDGHNLEALESAIRRFDRIEAVSVALRAIQDRTVSVPALYDRLAEILVDTGADWHLGTVEVWQEHLITGIARSVVEACAVWVEERAPAERSAIVVLAAPDDEFHDLGLRMLADRFTLAGWRSHFLGAAVPVGELIRAVGELGADAVALSTSTHFHRLALQPYVASLREVYPQLRVWVGGPAFAYERGSWSAEMVLDPRSVPMPEEVTR